MLSDSDNCGREGEGQLYITMKMLICTNVLVFINELLSMALSLSVQMLVKSLRAEK
jgi:hypothetical protein